MPKILDYALVINGGLDVDTKLIIPVLAADPSGGDLVDGAVWFNSTDNVFRYYDGTTVVTPGSGSLSLEQVRDDLATVLVPGGNIDIVVDDALDTITFSVEALTSADLSDFASAAVTAVNAGTIDADTLGGDSKATILSAAAAAAVATIVDTAPGTLDTLNELAAALGDDPNFVTTITALIAAKAGHYSVALAGGATTEVVTHNLNTRDVLVGFHKTATTYDADREWLWQATSVNTITVVSEAGNIPSGYTVTVVGK